MSQVVNSILLLYANDSCILYLHEEVENIFENICDWFGDKKLRIHFGEEKTKSILFASKRRTKNVC